MKITLQDIGKKYTSEWIFKSIDLDFELGSSYAITGHNGSGKSTLLQIILGTVIPTKGKVILPFSKDDIYQNISFVSPYQQLPLDLSLRELLQIHTKCKPFEDQLDIETFIKSINLSEVKDKLLQNYSSGMIQRVKLGLAIYSKSNVILLDEPTISLDNENVEWYLSEIKRVKKNKLVIISSNEEKEYSFCNDLIDITKYKSL